MNSIERALQLALAAHEGQVDKAGKPYILHPMTVASLQKTEECIIVALLHDVVEDAKDRGFTLEYIADHGFSYEVIEALRLLTHDKDVDYFEYIHAIKQNEIARKVKLADLAHNSDLSRLEKVTDKDMQRKRKYEKAMSLLLSKPA